MKVYEFKNEVIQEIEGFDDDNNGWLENDKII